jgi:glutathione S-transferase
LEIEDGKYIWDSHAINCYLVNRYAKNDSLYPKDHYLHAIVDQRLHFESGVLFPYLKSINYPLVYHNEREIPEWKYECIRESYVFCEKFLEHWNYFCGNSLTIADFHFIATITSLEAYIPVHADQYPRLFAWLKRMQALPYYNEFNGLPVQKFIELVHQKLHGH